MRVVMLLLVAVTACHTASSPDPAALPQWRFDRSAEAVDAYRAAMDSIFRTTVPKVSAVIAVGGVVITVIADKARAIRGYGIGGRTFSPFRIELYIDPTVPELHAVLRDGLASLLAHELHHAARWRTVGYGATLLEAMISEGLADQFSIELLGVPLPPWASAFPDTLTDSLTARARHEFDWSGYDHANWFFDADPTLPRWTGYTLGHRYVRAYQRVHGGASAASLVSTPAQTFRPK